MDHKCHTTRLARFFHIALTINCRPKDFMHCWSFFTPLLVLLTSKHLCCSPEQLVKNTNCGEKLIGLRTYGTRNLSISAFYQWMVPDGTYTTSLFVPGCRNMLLDIKSCFAFFAIAGVCCSCWCLSPASIIGNGAVVKNTNRGAKVLPFIFANRCK